MKRLEFHKSIAFTREIEKIVPGGAHTYSRGRDQFPEQAPSGIVRGSGARVWDADGNCLIDWSMGLTSVSLGHAHPAVNQAVTQAIAAGVSFQRPSQMEFAAARLWLDVCGDDMVKFGRHGSAVTSAAVKLARAYTGRACVAVAAEHPFFSFDDWFISSTPCDLGIPEGVSRYTLKFGYNDIASLHRLFREHPGDIACVILEPVKFDAPVPGFLDELLSLCRANGALVIFDEMITGLKFGVPGAQSRFGVRGDMTTWGKGIGNGFAISALTGRGDVMRLGGLEPEGARKLFLLSSTHGGESVGFAALSATVRQFLDRDIVGANWRAGENLQARLRTSIQRAGLSDFLDIQGYPPLFAISARGPDHKPSAAFSTLLRQEMIVRGVLFQGLFFLTPSHDETIIDETLVAFDEAVSVYGAAIEQGSTDGLLQGPPIKPVFRRFL